MITVSDNVATDLLIGRVGVKAVNRGTREQCRCFRVNRGRRRVLDRYMKNEHEFGDDGIAYIPIHAGGLMLAELSSRISPWFQYRLPIEIPEPPLSPPAAGLESAHRGSSAKRARGSDFGVLSAICPPQLVDQVVAECGCGDQRRRLLPARETVFGLLLMCLHPQLGYQRLMNQLAQAMPLGEGWAVPNKSSFFRARLRVGKEVLEQLFRVLARPLAEPSAQGCWWRERRVMAIDGSTLVLADSPELEALYGGPTTHGKRRVGSPQARMVALLECGTRALVNATMGPYRSAETTLLRNLLPSIEPGMLILGDRDFPRIELWKQFLSRGADLLWRANSRVATHRLRNLGDGSYLAAFGLNHHGRPNKHSLVVRLIEYRLPESETTYRLLTNLLDPVVAPAAELASLYAERWEIEIFYGQLKTAQCELGMLRSQTIEGVEQEFWAHCLLYQISRHVAYRAAMITPERDCDRIPCALLLDVLRRGAVWVRSGPRTGATLLRLATYELVASRVLLRRRDRAAPRVSTPSRMRHRYPERESFDGPTTTARPRRPAVLLNTHVTA
jgi:hypothetical protein